MPRIVFVSEVTRNLLAIVAFVGVLLWLSWKATLMLFFVVPPVVALANYIGSRVRRVTELEREGEARYVDILTRTLEALPFVRAFASLLPRVAAGVREGLRTYLDYGYKNLYLSVLQQGANDLTMNFATVLAMIVAGYYLFIRELTFGGFMAFTNTFWRSVTSIFNFFKFKQLPEAQRYDQILSRLEELFTAQALLPPRGRGPASRTRGRRHPAPGPALAFRRGARVAGGVWLDRLCEKTCVRPLGRRAAKGCRCRGALAGG